MNQDQESVCVNITTLAQMQYWLGLGEIAVAKYRGGHFYMRQIDDELNVIMQPKFGGCDVFTKKFTPQALASVMILTDQWIVCKGARIESRKLNWADKIIVFLRKLKVFEKLFSDKL